MKRVTLFVVVMFVLALVLAGVGTALASGNGTVAGQPNQSCQAEPSTPGGAASAPGSAFNTSGVAGTVYAGQQPQNSGNPNAVSQYDVACFEVSSH